MALAYQTAATTISAEEQERRRRNVYSAFHSNAMEGLKPNSDCQHVFDAYIAGEIELSEMMPRVKAILGIQ
jgi:hypothetical protein